MLSATVCGSFHRHLGQIYTSVEALRGFGVDVLSPSDPRVVDEIGDFIFVASDRIRSVRLVEDRHLDCIRASSFVLLIAPDGYVGPSAAFELGFAIASNVPIFTTANLQDLDTTLRLYIHQFPNIENAVDAARVMSQTHRRFKTFLVDPRSGIEAVHANLDRLASSLAGPHTNDSRELERETLETRRGLLDLLGVTIRDRSGERTDK